ncbi:mitochondrial disaggregase-like [Bolinopsis microptera]|uniref:mitochondrial disaggregase-like n=1 Tax=Bolinopsis microptera TaxID=2820187 RepID=UPI00307A9021
MLLGRTCVRRILHSQTACVFCAREVSHSSNPPTVSLQYHQDHSRKDYSDNSNGFNKNSSNLKYAAPFILLNVSALLASKKKDGADDIESRELATMVLEDGQIDIVKVRKLLKDGADPNFRYQAGWSLIHVGAARGNVQLVKMLTRFGVDVNVADQYPPGNISKVDLVNVHQQRLTLNPNYKLNVNWAGFTPLHYAVINDDVKMVKVLVEAGASVNSRTNTGFLPVDLAADSEIKKMLKEQEQVEKKKRILSLGPFLKDKVIGQESALALVTSAVQRRDLGWQDDKPLVMLFVGSSGIGKTETAKQLAAHKNDNNPDSKVSFIRIDMSEFQERHEVSKFIGSPPGYIGHDEGGQLTKALTDHPESVVLFDEVEKAHPDVLNIMLQLFDEGRLTDGKGKTILCPNALFVMTTNVGADQIANSASEIDEDFKKYVMYPELKRAFRRNEFLGRINEIVYFLPFTSEQCLKLVERELLRIKQYAEKQNIEVSWSDSAVALLATAIDSNYGARSLKNEVSRRVVNKIADMNLENKIRAGSKVYLTVLDGQIQFNVS